MNELFLPGLEPDFDVKKELRLIGGMPDLHQFDFVFISCSGGKDSHAMAYLLAELADRQKYNKNKMELLYADTGLEWHDTFDQVKRIGQSIGIQAVMVTPKYKLLDNVRRRWAKFNGLEWEDSRAEQSRAEQSRADDPQSGRTEAWRVRSRTLLNGSARAITNDFQSSSMSVSEQQDYVVQKPRETVSNRTLRSQSIRGGGGYVEQTISKYPRKILHHLGKARATISIYP